MSTIYDRIRARRLELGLTVEDLAQQLGYKDKSSISKIENGKADILQAKVELFANALHTTTAYLMGVDGPALPPGCEPLPRLKRLPLVGRIACGMPILAEQNIEGDVAVPEEWHADFILTCRGDSMAPQIQAGDLALVHSQETLQSGEIGVVLLEDDEATIKRVVFSGRSVILQPFNNAYTPIALRGDECRILGKVIRTIREW